MINKIKIKDIGEVISGSTPKTDIKEYWNGNNNWITPAELSEESYLIDETERKITDLAINKTSLRKLPKGTVLLTTRAPIGKVAIANADMYCNQGFKNIVCNEKIYNRFLYYFLKSKTDYLNSLGRGATFKEISKSIVEEIEIPYYELEEQKKIVIKLDKINDLIKIDKTQIELFDNLVKAYYCKLFEDKQFDKKTLEEITTKITDGSHTPPSGINENLGYLMLSSQNIINDKINNDNARYLTKEDFEKENKRTDLKKGDVLLTIVGTVGRTAIITDEKNITLQRSVAVLKPIKELKSEYLVGALKSDDVVCQLNKGAKGVAQKGIYLKDIKKLIIPVPPIELQNKFAIFVDKINKQKDKTQKNLEELFELRDNLMNKFFN